jgi:hypothetical protein
MIGDLARETGYLDVWAYCLGAYLRPPTGPDVRARQADLIGAYLGELRRLCHDPRGLRSVYHEGSSARLDLAKRLLPTEWRSVHVYACAAVAFAVRWLEVRFDCRLDPRRLPAWVAEWGI